MLKVQQITRRLRKIWYYSTPSISRKSPRLRNQYYHSGRHPWVAVKKVGDPEAYCRNRELRHRRGVVKSCKQCKDKSIRWRRLRGISTALESQSPRAWSDKEITRCSRLKAGIRRWRTRICLISWKCRKLKLCQNSERRRIIQSSMKVSTLPLHKSLQTILARSEIKHLRVNYSAMSEQRSL